MNQPWIYMCSPSQSPLPLPSPSLTSKCWYLTISGLPSWLSGKEFAWKVGDTRDASLISGSGRSPGVGNENPFQHACLENSLDIGARWATVHEVAKSWTWLSAHAHTHTHIHTHTHTHSHRHTHSHIHTYLTRSGKNQLDFSTSGICILLPESFSCCWSHLCCPCERPDGPGNECRSGVAFNMAGRSECVHSPSHALDSCLG